MRCDPDSRDVPERADLAGRQTRFLPNKLAQTLENEQMEKDASDRD